MENENWNWVCKYEQIFRPLIIRPIHTDDDHLQLCCAPEQEKTAIRGKRRSGRDFRTKPIYPEGWNGWICWDRVWLLFLFATIYVCVYVYMNSLYDGQLSVENNCRCSAQYRSTQNNQIGKLDTHTNNEEEEENRRWTLLISFPSLYFRSNLIIDSSIISSSKSGKSCILEGNGKEGVKTSCGQKFLPMITLLVMIIVIPSLSADNNIKGWL